MGEIEAERRFFEPSKGENGRDGGRDDNGQHECVTCRHLRSLTHARAVLVPRFVPESPHINQLEELPLQPVA